MQRKYRICTASFLLAVLFSLQVAAQEVQWGALNFKPEVADMNECGADVADDLFRVLSHPDNFPKEEFCGKRIRGCYDYYTEFERRCFEGIVVGKVEGGARLDFAIGAEGQGRQSMRWIPK